MTNEEIICTWMEPKPHPRTHSTDPSVNDWWSLDMYGSKWRPRSLTLDALREVQDRLSRDQWWSYELELSRIARHHESTALGFIHATSEEKIEALAAVLRPLVEKGVKP